MSTMTYYKTEKARNLPVQAMQKHLTQWHSALDQLDIEVYQINSENQETYLGDIDYWRERLHQMQVRLQAMIEGDNHKEWIKGWPELLERLSEFREGFLKITNDLQVEVQPRELDWMQSFVYERDQELLSWRELDS
jgi:hypothetical protein